MTGGVLHLDLETRSAVDLRKAGAHRYAEDPTTSIVCGSYRFDNGPVKSWFGTDVPYEVAEHLALGGRMAGHNQQFERVVLSQWLGQWIKPEQQDCTMARGLALGLPASLEQLGEALNASIQKDKDGHRLMMTMCKPRGVNADGSFAWWEDADRLQRLSAYCGQDVASECSIDALLPPLSQRERRVWELDQRINDRGFAVDLPVVQKARAVVDAAAKKADREMWALTNGAVKRCTETGKIVAWINAQGVPCSRVAKGEIDDLVLGAEVLDKPVVAQVVRLRRATARSSTAKYKAMLDSACRDGRIRGTLNYHRAHTGRWGGAGVQPQNFPRVDDPAAVEAALELLRGDGSPIEIVDQIDFFVGPTMEVLSKCLRSMIVAAPGCELLGGDFTNIEGRINAWLNGETWKLDAFRAYDAGTGPDLYRVMAAAVNEKPVEEVTAVERQVSGKVPELACLGPDTLVFTDNGLKPIKDVGAFDRLWDGEEWVEHKGLVHRGRKATVWVNGVEMTPDHQLLVDGQNWEKAQTVVSSPSLSALASATASASLPSWVTVSGLPEAFAQSWYGVLATKIEFMESLSPTFAEVNRLAAIVARERSQVTRERTTGATPTSSRTMGTDAVFSIVSVPVLTAATILTMQRFTITGGVEFRSMSLGDAIAEAFSRTSSLWKDGTTTAWSWIEPASTRATNPETFDSSHVERIKEIVERSSTYKDGSTSSNFVFDIAHAGPRSRFMVWGREGPLIVHNCGYQGALGAFQKMAYTQNPPVRVADDLAKRIVALWREQNPNIVQGWWDLQDAAIEAVGAPGCVVEVLRGRVAYVMAHGFLFCRLPSSRVIAYPRPRLVWSERTLVDENGDEFTIERRSVEYMGVDSVTKRWGPQYLYGGAQMNHVVQGAARDRMVEAMFAVEDANLPIVLTVHDELLSEVEAGAATAEQYADLMMRQPAWAEGLPVAVKTWKDMRYVK